MFEAVELNLSFRVTLQLMFLLQELSTYYCAVKLIVFLCGVIYGSICTLMCVLNHFPSRMRFCG